MKQRRVLLIGGGSLFGSGIIKLLEKGGENLEIEKVRDIEAALKMGESFKPDVIIYLREKKFQEDDPLFEKLKTRYRTRTVQCTLEANQLTIYDEKQIQNATVEDLISAVMK